ncbi:MAG: hypothetical protein AAGH71_07035 [Planctomycetota bacterium]
MSFASTRASGTLIASEPALAIEWSIARDAVRDALPDLELPPAHRRGGDVVLCITVTRSSCSAELRDTRSGETHPVELGAVKVDSLRADEFVHVTVREGHDTLLAATVREEPGPSRLLYAHTSLFDRLGIRGGRYARPMLSAE